MGGSSLIQSAEICQIRVIRVLFQLAERLRQQKKPPRLQGRSSFAVPPCLHAAFAQPDAGLVSLMRCNGRTRDCSDLPDDLPCFRCGRGSQPVTSSLWRRSSRYSFGALSL